MLKLLYLVNQRLPTEKAYGIQITEMCKAFAGRSLNVTLVAPYRKNLIKKSIFEYYNINRSFTFKKIISLDFYLPGSLDKIAVRVKNFLSAMVLTFYALLHKTDVIYSRDELPLYFLSFFKKNIFLEAHKFSESKLIFYKRFKNLGLKIITISQGIKDEFIKAGFKEEQILVAPDGVNFGKFDINFSNDEARQKVGLPINKKIVMYTGHLFDWKGVFILAESAEFLDDALVVFIGGMKNDILKFKEKFGVRDNILIIDQRPHKEIPFFLKAADVLVLPNSAKEKISQSYTSPLKLFEYMVVKRPIVASNISSILEVLNKNNAILVKPDSAESLAEGIRLALQDKNLADSVSHRAFLDVQNYTWQKRSKNILNFLTNVSTLR